MRSLYTHLKSKRVLTPVMALLVLAGVYLAGARIPCVFYRVTGYLCPGCGITRMCLALVHLDFVTAFSNNPLCFVLSIPFGGYFLYYLYRSIQEREYREIPKPIIYMILVVTIVFWITRNLPGFEFLRPLV